MSKFLRGLLLFFICCSSLQALALPDAVEMAKQTRVNSLEVMDTPGEIQRIESILETLIAQLPDYTSEFLLPNALQKMLKETIQLEVPLEQIVNIKGTPLSGRSKDIVFFIQDQQGNLLYVVKALRNPKSSFSHFAWEISAMAFLEEQKFQASNNVKLLAVGKAYTKDICYGLILETAAPGMRFLDFMRGIASAERKSYFAKILRAYTQAGYALGELQASRPPELGDFPEESCEKIKNALQEYLKTPAAQLHSAELDPEMLTDYVQQVLENIKKVEHYRVIWHGDAHIGNFIYAHDSNTFTMIDLGRMHESIALDGHPMGDLGYDYIRFCDDMDIKCRGLFTVQEREQIREHFTQAYNEKAAIPITEHHRRFYEVYVRINRLRSNAKYLDLPAGPQRDDCHQIFRAVLEDLLRMYAEKQAIRRIRCCT